MSKPLTFGRSKFFQFVCLWLVGGSALGCGGEVDTGQTAASGASSSTATTDSNAGAGAGGSQSNSAFGDQTLLPDCKAGFDPAQASANTPCAFFIGKTCYSTQDAACACACPRNQGPVLCVADANAYLPGTDAFGVWCVPKT